LTELVEEKVVKLFV